MKKMPRQNKDCKYLSDMLHALLEMERSLVGVKLIRDKGEYDGIKIKELKVPIHYCQMAASASRGHRVKATKEQFHCSSGVRVLGFDHRDDKNSNGENWVNLGLYGEKEVSQAVRKRIDFIPEGTYGILLQPLEEYVEIPDIVLIVTTPYNIMRLTQGYGYYYGEAKQISMVGNQAICLECTAAPYVNQDINISSLCIGTRHRAGWKDTEMAMGIPGSKFADVVDGVMATLNIMESDEKKKRIEKALEEAGILHEKIEYRHNYYMDC